MATERESLSQKIERIQKSVQQLPAAAVSLNSATDQLGKSISELDAVLKKFSLGVPTWVPFTETNPHWFPDIYQEEVGYAKVGGKWGVAIRTVEAHDPRESPDIEQWLFADAPRLFRVQAVEKIPDLIEALLTNAANMTETIINKAAEVDALTAGIKSAIEPPEEKTSIGKMMQSPAELSKIVLRQATKK
jgi:hypothetical protein